MHSVGGTPIAEGNQEVQASAVNETLVYVLSYVLVIVRVTTLIMGPFVVLYLGFSPRINANKLARVKVFRVVALIAFAAYLLQVRS